MSILRQTLPKSWKDWCKAAKLRPRDKGRDKRGLKSTWFYLHGHGREWRVNCFGDLCVGVTYDEFDRWALSDSVEKTMPKTKIEFLTTVRAMCVEVQQNTPQ